MVSCILHILSNWLKKLTCSHRSSKWTGNGLVPYEETFIKQKVANEQTWTVPNEETLFGLVLDWNHLGLVQCFSRALGHRWPRLRLPSLWLCISGQTKAVLNQSYRKTPLTLIKGTKPVPNVALICVKATVYLWFQWKRTSKVCQRCC